MRRIPRLSPGITFTHYHRAVTIVPSAAESSGYSSTFSKPQKVDSNHSTPYSTNRITTSATLITSQTMSLCFLEAGDEYINGTLSIDQYIAHLVAHFCQDIYHDEDQQRGKSRPSAEEFRRME
jgi:hypothetical protein